MFKLVFDEEAIDFLNILPKEMRERIFNKTSSTKENPFHFFERLVGREDYKLRVGDYRIIVDIDASVETIIVTQIGHRSKIYKNQG